MDGYTQDYGTLIKQATDRASSLASSSGALASQLPNVGDLIRTKATEAYNNNQDIIKPLDTATSSYLTASQAGREKFQDIFNPFSREKLVAQYIQSQALPMLSLSSILGNRMGRIQDIIGAGTNAFQSQVSAQQAEADAAQSYLNNLFKQYGIETDTLNTNRQFNADEAYRQEQLAMEKERLRRSGVGSSDNGFSSALINSLLMGGGQVAGQSAQQRPPLDSFDQPAAPAAPGRWNPLAQFGAVGDLLGGGLKGLFR